MHNLWYKKTSPPSQAWRLNHLVDLAWLERERVRPDAEAALLVYTLDPCRQRRPLGAVLVVIHALDFQHQRLPVRQSNHEVRNESPPRSIPHVVDQIGRASCRERVCQYV